MANNSLIWIDLEMTGLDPTVDRIIEIATIVTDSELTILGEGPVLVIHQPKAVMDNMNAWCVETHGKTGLTDAVKKSQITETIAEQATIDFLSEYISPGISPMCGNTVYQDRRFLRRYMPKLHDFFHYRHIDVSTLKELAARWQPELLKGVQKTTQHRALDDIKESIDELRYYRSAFMKQG